MSKSQHLKLVLVTLLLASTFAVTPIKHLAPLHFKKKPQPLTQKAKWTPVTVVGLTSAGISTVYHFDSANAQAGFIIHDAASGQSSSTCYTQAIVNETIYGSISEGFTNKYCSLSSISRIDRYGHVLFINGDGSYVYSVTQGGLSSLGLQIEGNFQEAIAQGVEFGVTKSTDGEGNDYFRLFSRAADAQGNYPANFYALVANSTGDSFAEGLFNTLTLKKFGWNFKNTTKQVSSRILSRSTLLPTSARLTSWRPSGSQERVPPELRPQVRPSPRPLQSQLVSTELSI